jgi:molybdenum cofactor cytidylyltransferase
MIFAVVPAAGHSTRMGRTKLTLPLGGRTVLEHVVAALRDGGVDRVLVVIGPHVPEMIPLAVSAGADTALLRKRTPDMRATVEHGLRWLETQYHPATEDYWLLVPADHPTLGSDVICRLVDAVKHSGRSIALPVFEGRRGHPTLFAWRHVVGIRALPEDQGINAYLRMHGDEVLEVSVSDASVLADLDTPEDYERLIAAADERSTQVNNPGVGLG